MTSSTQDLACEVSAPARARRWIAERLRAVLPDDPAAGRLVDDAVLCVSELVTNALQAGCTTATLRLDTGEGSVRLSLSDNAPGRPQPRASGPRDLRGRGLAIIEALARAWGVDPAGSGKVVWVELGRTA
jgi:anti-sigma regulatory factor (Ser/Thr protein kinase)